ncbi:DUF6584 family protein [Micromonospora parathelypteridis]|uniref:Uncharacterized protein n=1 Tax=Micromonospora parathelypteridis TaxID=1839617 RepID=A0A840W8L6_9ACTN|nr:DUF6584 family protein [Micromonospora parathelypteridis]MBB5481358.1 hypothetical protein [Micromonospora parathelypteridis]GGO18905.1 hypothetical protein GCM10011576_34370 [Micromonospora parathelypteridis]
MAKEHVLAKVDADLRRGHVHPAMQRLASLNAAYPDDLELRARRAALYRQVGNVAEAGRWGFLSEEATAEEAAAFERAYPGAWQRLLVLKVTADPSDRLGPLAGARLRRLVEQAGEEGPAPVTWVDVGPRPGEPSSWLDELGCLVAAVFGLIAVALAVVGLITVIRWAL